MTKRKKGRQKKYFFEPNQSKQKSFNSHKRIEEIILSYISYNILIELYVMINKSSLILY